MIAWWLSRRVETCCNAFIQWTNANTAVSICLSQNCCAGGHTESNNSSVILHENIFLTFKQQLYSKKIRCFMAEVTIRPIAVISMLGYKLIRAHNWNLKFNKNGWYVLSVGNSGQSSTHAHGTRIQKSRKYLFYVTNFHFITLKTCSTGIFNVYVLSQPNL